MGEQPPPLGRVYSIADATAFARCGRRKIEYALASGDLTGYRHGRRVLIWERDLIAWLRTGERLGGTPGGGAA